jgi:putative ABC transport system permease protein
VILSHALWTQVFGASPDIVGHRIMLEGVSREVVGVMPPDFQFPSAKTEIWVPINLDPRNVGAYWGGPFIPVIARLNPGATQEQANSELHILLRRILAMFP